MNILDIKAKAEDVLSRQKNYINVLIFMGIFHIVITTLCSLFTGTIGTLVSLILWVVFLPFEHGYIVSSLKLVNNYDDQLDVQKDGLVGFYRFKELFSTYFIYNFLLVVIEIIIVIFLLLIGLVIIPKSQILDLKDAFSQMLTMLPYANGVSSMTSQVSMNIDGLASIASYLVLIGFVLLVVAIYYVTAFSLTPYILEKYKLTGFVAMKESYRLMKNNKWTLIKLYFSFIGWLLVSAIFINIISILLSIFPLGIITTLITNIISVFIAVHLVDAKLYTCLAVFYEEIDYADKNIVNQE